MNSSIATINNSSKTSLFSQEFTSELNDKSGDGITNSKKYHNNKCQLVKIENQILYVKNHITQNIRNLDYRMRTLNGATDSVTSLNNSVHTNDPKIPY